MVGSASGGGGSIGEGGGGGGCRRQLAAHALVQGHMHQVAQRRQPCACKGPYPPRAAALAALAAHLSQTPSEHIISAPPSGGIATHVQCRVPVRGKGSPSRRRRV